jgi:outer membrane protein assembly factor BamB
MKKIVQWICGLSLGCSVVVAGNWLTFGGDPQRDGWAKDETTLNKDNVKSLEVNWKLHLDNEAKELNSLTVPLVVEKLITPRGFKDLVIVAGSSDSLFAVDADTGKLFWSKKFMPQGTPKNQAHWLCPNALNDTPVIMGGRDKGVFVIASDGKLHILNVNNGEDKEPPLQFVPAFSKNWSLSIAGNTLYTTISQGCNGAASGVYAMDLNDPKHPISFFQANAHGAGIWGRGGAAISPSGTVIAETGDGTWDPAANKLSDTFLALSPKDLKLVNYYTPTNFDWITRKDLDMGNITPVAFRYKGRELLVGSGKEGRLFLLDLKSIGGEDHRTPLYRSPLITNEDVDFAGRGFWGAFASWQDEKQTRWVYAPAWGPKHPKAPDFPITNGDAPNGSIMAFKVEDKDGKPTLAPAWISRDLNVPEPPVVAGGVVFAISSGEYVRQAKDSGGLFTSEDRVKASTHATLYAFDAETGKELFSSADTMPAFTHFGGLAIANGRVFMTTYDNTLWAYGLKQEQ